MRDRLRLFVVLTLLLCSFPDASAATRLYIDSRPTIAAGDRRATQLIFREIPRQALFIAAAHDLHLICIDPTVEPDVTPAPDDVKLGFDVDNDPQGLKITIYASDGTVLSSATARPERIGRGEMLMSSYANKLDILVQRDWTTLLAKQANVAVAPAKWDPQLPAPDESDRLLRTIDFQHAFLAAQLTHRAIAGTGESPARLGVLVRAYAHLGESTRHLINGQSSAFFARSLVYAQRLRRLAPKEVETYWHTAYAQALFGVPKFAANELAEADRLSNGRAGPGWVVLTRNLLKFDVTAMNDKLGGRDAPIAAYFGWLAVMDSPLEMLNIRFTRWALEQNPGALRAHDALMRYGALAVRAEAADEGPKVLNRLIATLAEDPAAAQPIQAAVKRTLDSQFAVGAIVNLLTSFDQQPREPSQLLPWATYAAIVRDAQFIHCLRQLEQLKYWYAVDASDLARDWLNLVGKHRYADFVRSFLDRPSREVLERAAHLPLKDDALPGQIFGTHMARALNMRRDPVMDDLWSFRHARQADGTVPTYTEQIWLYTGREVETDRKYIGELAADLELICPDHPLVVSARLSNAPRNLEKLIASLTAEERRNPSIAYALGKALTSLKRFEEAVTVLKPVIAISQDKDAYLALAQAHLQNNDEASWLACLEEYLAGDGDGGLGQSAINYRIAMHFLDTQRPDRALPFAKKSAESYSQSGLQVYELALTRLRRYDEAAQIHWDEAERYGAWPKAYRYARLTGRGDLEQVIARYRLQLKKPPTAPSPVALVDEAYFHLTEDGGDQSLALMRQAFKQGDDDPFIPVALASLLLDTKATDEAKSILIGLGKRQMTTARARGYAACAAELLRCAEDPKARPTETPEIAAALSDPELRMAAGNIAYYLGQAAERQGLADEAKKWYRRSLDEKYHTFTCAHLSAMALRRLGDEYFK